jgi:hypothetical protein
MEDLFGCCDAGRGKYVLQTPEKGVWFLRGMKGWEKLQGLRPYPRTRIYVAVETATHKATRF